MTDWEAGLQAFHEGRMRAAADKLREAGKDQEMTVTLTARLETLAYLGAALYALGLPAEAVPAFEDALRLSSPAAHPVELILNLANAYLATGRRDDARQMLQFALKQAPGNIPAQMLLQRLESAPASKPVTGAVMGASVESVRTYLRTLTFATVSQGGYDPAQVREALTQIAHYIDALDGRLQVAQEILAQNEAEIDRYRQMEDALVQNMMQSRSSPGEEDQVGLSPIERLFQNKP